MRCPNGFAQEPGVEFIATVGVFALLILNSIYLGVSGARALRRQRLVVSYDKRQVLKGRSAVVGGAVLITLGAAGLVFFIDGLFCALQAIRG